MDTTTTTPRQAKLKADEMDLPAEAQQRLLAARQAMWNAEATYTAAERAARDADTAAFARRWDRQGRRERDLRAARLKAQAEAASTAFEAQRQAAVALRRELLGLDA